MSISEQYIFGPSTVAKVDYRAIHEFSMPGIELMEKAAAYAFESSEECFPNFDSIQIFCGSGNNAGDAYLFGCYAIDHGITTSVIYLSNPKTLKGDAYSAYQRYKAKEGKLIPDEYNGGTITISNLGMYGINEFSAIINPPQSSILAVGSINDVIILDKNNEVKSIKTIKFTLSADHRVLDGAIAAKLTGKPHVWHIREPIGSGNLFRFWVPDKILAKIFDLLSTYIVPMSKSTSTIFQNHTDPTKLRIIYDGIDPKEFANRDMRGFRIFKHAKCVNRDL